MISRSRLASLATSSALLLSIASMPAGAAAASPVATTASHSHAKHCHTVHHHRRCIHIKPKPKPVPAPTPVPPQPPVTGPGSPGITPAEEQSAVERLMQPPTEPVGLYGGGGGCKC